MELRLKKKKDRKGAKKMKQNSNCTKDFDLKEKENFNWKATRTTLNKVVVSVWLLPQYYTTPGEHKTKTSPTIK